MRAVTQFVQQAKSINVLELLDNKITKLGCEFIGKTLHPRANCNIQILKLDHNDIGGQGVTALVEGLAINQSLQMLSLTYCDIDQSGARAIFELLIYSKSNLEELNLSGNHLRNEGVIVVFRGLSINKKLKKIYLADNQFNEHDSVLAAIEQCWNKNKNLGRYDLRYNTLTDYGVGKFTTYLETANHVFEVEIPERVSKETLESFRERLAANKPKKGKKGKKGKKKKK